MISVQAFVEKYNGKSIDFDKYYGAQCVDLFNFYVQDVLGGPRVGTPATGGASDLYTVESTARAESFKKLGTSVKLQIGDVLVYGKPHGRHTDNGKTAFWGHVAIYIGNNKLIQQNGRVSQKTTVDPVFKVGLLGVLRPLRFIAQSAPQEVSDESKNKNKHKIEPGDTFWGLEEKLGYTHGTLQELNPGVDPLSLQIGSEIIIKGEKNGESEPAKTYYEIRAGDTFWGLEDAWQLNHGTLQQLNPGIDPKGLQIGQRIRRS